MACAGLRVSACQAITERMAAKKEGKRMGKAGGGGKNEPRQWLEVEERSACRSLTGEEEFNTGAITVCDELGEEVGGRRAPR